MLTLKPINSVYSQFIAELKAIKISTQIEFEEQVKVAKKNLVERMLSVRDTYPQTLSINYARNLSSERANTIVNTIKESVQENYSIPVLPTDKAEIHKVLNEVLITPTFFHLDSNTTIHTNKEGLADWILMLLLSMPIKSIRLNIVDTEGTMLADYVYANINKKLYHDKPITLDSEYINLLEKLNNQQIATIQKYGDIVDYNESHSTIIRPYEVVVVISEPTNFNKSLKNSLCKSGKRAGIYFVHVRPDNSYKGEDTLITSYTKKTSHGLIYPTPIVSIPSLLSSCLEYINAEADKVDVLERRVIRFN